MAYRNATPKVWYQVKSGESWLTCRFASVQPNGWLHYELPDSTNGLARPGTWRVKPTTKQASKVQS
jgi:hypothetical protein